jgi:chromosome segregation ATPase
MNFSSKNDQGDLANTPLSHAPIDQSAGNSSQASPPVPRVVAVCPACKATLSVRRAYVGSAVRCKHCDQIFKVPAELDTPPGPDGARASGGSTTQASQDESGSQRAGIGDKTDADQFALLLARYNALRSAFDKLQAQHDDLRADRDLVGSQLNLYERDLGAIRAERVALTTNFTQQNSELAVARTELVQLTQRLEKSDADLQAAREETDQLTQQLALSRNDITQAQADQRQLSDERQNALDTVERLTKTLAERDLSIRDQIDLHVAEIESKRQAFDLAERNHLDDRQRLTAELAAAHVRNQQLQEELQSAESSCTQLRDTNQELVTAQARRESEHDAMLTAERAERQQLADDLMALRASAGQTAQAGEQSTSANVIPPDGPHASAGELEAARTEAEELKWKLDEAEYHCRVMAETLRHLGVSYHMRTRPDNDLAER